MLTIKRLLAEAVMPFSVTLIAYTGFLFIVFKCLGVNNTLVHIVAITLGIIGALIFTLLEVKSNKKSPKQSANR